jgi:hypothetical protein
MRLVVRLRQVAIEVARLTRLHSLAELAVDAVGAPGPRVRALNVLISSRGVVPSFLLRLQQTGIYWYRYSIFFYITEMKRKLAGTITG